MATVIRKTDPSITLWATAFNALKAQIGPGALFHLDASETTITAADATTLPTLLVLVNQMISVAAITRGDLLCHKAADATALPVLATDLATAQTALNLLKSQHNTHCASTAIHFNADGTNTCATTNMSDLASGLTLANALKANINAHMASAPAAASIRAVDC